VIGVISRAGQTGIVEEFFELFKTPWELYRSGREYDIVIVSSNPVETIDAKLVIICGADSKDADLLHTLNPDRVRCGEYLRARDTLVPLYGEVLSFRDIDSVIKCICVTADSEVVGLKIETGDRSVIRLGYDLFAEVGLLLSAGQPAKNAHIPTLDMHIDLLQQWILDCGIGFVEIPPSPAGYNFCISLTHDIDFVGIRNHKFDHTMFGFLHRATVGALSRFLRHRLSFAQLLECWRATSSLPLVFLGWMRDFWEPFAWYLEVEKGLPTTYFLIPFKGRAGENVRIPHASRRASGYEVADLSSSVNTLMQAGCEIGVHGVDAWHSSEKGKEEFEKIRALTRKVKSGIRMHWLLRDDSTFQILEEAGYVYDSTVGYNETVGFRSGTTQVFRPLGVKELLELPLHIQDGALFYPSNLDLSHSDAWSRCQDIVNHADTAGGVLTVLWHDRSHAPERFWGDFYKSFVAALRSCKGWFASAIQVVSWFRKRRAVRFRYDGLRMWLVYDGEEIVPHLVVRVHRPAGTDKVASSSNSAIVDIPWNGTASEELNALIDQRLSSMDQVASERQPAESLL
jgi:peptidoglycan/xylan/chitin deacetylase (PgdA/CDA1 family)